MRSAPSLSLCCMIWFSSVFFVEGLRINQVSVSRITNLHSISTKYASRAVTSRGLFIDGSILPIFKCSAAVHGVLATILSQIPGVPLTKVGLVHATILGTGLWTFLGPKGWAAAVIYFILGSLVTKIKMQEKERQGIAEKRGGKRGPENVWGSAAAAMVCAIMTYITPEYSAALQVGYVASLATKLSDTFASEIGKAYGKNTYLITTLKMVPRGTEGAISVEGTLAGVLGSIIMAAICYPLGLITSVRGFVACIFAAFVATTVESYIGAIFQDKYPWLTNELVNLINTVIGAVTAILIMLPHH